MNAAKQALGALVTSGAFMLLCWAAHAWGYSSGRARAGVALAQEPACPSLEDSLMSLRLFRAQAEVRFQEMDRLRERVHELELQAIRARLPGAE